jgi:hypothetical protein
LIKSNMLNKLDHKHYKHQMIHSILLNKYMFFNQEYDTKLDHNLNIM